MEYELTIRTNDRDELKALLSCDETRQGCPELGTAILDDVFPDEYVPDAGSRVEYADVSTRMVPLRWSTCIVCGTVNASPRWISTGEAGPFCSLACVEKHKEQKLAGMNLSNGDTLSWTITVSEPPEKPKELEAVLPDDYVPLAGSRNMACFMCGTRTDLAYWVSNGGGGPFCSLACVERHKAQKIELVRSLLSLTSIDKAPSTRAVISIAHDWDLESDACDCLERDDNSTVTGTDRGYHAFSDQVRDNLPRLGKGRQMPKIIGK